MIITEKRLPGPLGNAGWAPGRAQEPREGMCTGHCHAHPCSPTPRHKHLHLSSSQLTFWVEALPASSFLSCKDVGSPSLSSQMKGGGNMHHFPNQLLAKKKRKKKNSLRRRRSAFQDLLTQQQGGNVSHISTGSTGKHQVFSGRSLDGPRSSSAALGAWASLTLQPDPKGAACPGEKGTKMRTRDPCQGVLSESFTP